MSDTPTPRTDHALEHEGVTGETEVVRVLCHQLERDLAAAREEIAAKDAEIADVGAAAWIVEWMAAEKYHKPTIPAVIEKARKNYQRALARAEAAESRLLTVERERDALIEADRRHLGYYHKLVMDRNALKTERDALLEMATTRPEDQFDHATGDTFDTSAQCPMHGAATNAADASEVKP